MKYFFSILCFFLFTPIVSAELFITSVFPNTEDDTQQEYIELYNSSPDIFSLSGYTLSDASNKIYTFGSGTLLLSKIFTAFSRPETKILLNNTNETIFLKNPQGQVIDSISYISSIKGEKITFLDKIPKEIISDESYLWNPKIYYSDEVSLSPSTPDTPRVAPEIIFSFQQPSYILETDTKTSLYHCDTSNDDCRVNLDLRPSFTGGIRESDYQCRINFGFFSTESSKCNPSTVTLREGENTLLFQIFLKSDTSIVSERTIKIYNTKEVKNEENQEQGNTPGNTTDTPTVPDIKIALQQPSYVLFDAAGNLFCDRNKEQCKANFDLRDSFSSPLTESDFSCELSFGDQKILSCNPGTLDIPLGEQELLFKIISKSNPTLISEKRVTLKNEGPYLPSQKALSVSDTFKQSDFIHIKKPEILIQSGLIKKGRSFWCEGETCKVNLAYKKNNTKERCLWTFGEAIYKESSLTRCNPGVVEFEGGIHHIYLTVYQSNNKTNFMQSRLAFSYFPEEKEEKIAEEELFSPESFSGTVDIELQGKIGKNKTLEGKKLICTAKETCSVNLTSALSYSGKLSQAEQYFWDFGNGETYLGENPKSLSLPLGNYQIKLELRKGESILAQDNFLVEVQQGEKKVKEKDTKEEKLEESFSGNLSLLSLFPNPPGNDIREWIEIQNTGIGQVSLDSCFFKNGKKKSKFPLAYTLFPGESRKIFRAFSNFSLNNKQGKIELYCANIFQDTLSWQNGKQGDIFSKNGARYISVYSIQKEDFISEEMYRIFVEKTWKLNIRKLKSGIKISGETLAFQKIHLSSSQGKDYEIESDADGLFEILLDRDIPVGDIFFGASFTDSYENIFQFSSQEKLTISSTDRSNFLKKYTKKTKKKKTKKKKTPKIQKEPEIQILPLGKESLEDIQKELSLVFSLILIASLSILTLLGIYFLLPRKSGDILSTLLIFQTRQKLLLIL